MKKKTNNSNVIDLFKEGQSAIYKNDTNTLKKILENGFDPNFQDKEGKTLLFYTLLDDKIEFLTYLLQNKANPNIQDKLGWSALHYAAQNYRINIAKILIENGADVKIKDNYGNTPLFRATFESKGKGDIIKLLLNYGANPADVNNSGVSPLELANTIANYNVKQYFNN